MRDEPLERLAPVTVSTPAREEPAPAGNAATASAAALPDGLGARLEEITLAIQDVRESFDSKLKYDQYKEAQIKALSEEVLRLREGEQFRLLRPILTDLISMYDDLSTVVQRTQMVAPDTADTSELTRSLLSFQRSILGTLERYGVREYRTQGVVAEPERHHVIRAQETNDPAQDRRIAERQKPGFEIDGRVLRPEQVVIYRYVAR